MLYQIDERYHSFQDFYERTHRNVFLFALKHAPSEMLAEEILQTAYLKVWEKRETIQPEFLAFKSYLYSTVRNLIIKEYHRQVAEQEALLQYRHLITEQEPTENATNEILTEINKAVATLPEKQQAVFRMVKMEGMTYKEAAEAMAISESTVEKHIISALRALRSRLSNFNYTILL